MIQTEEGSSLTPIRNQYIDFLRGLAIFVVLLLHFNILYHLDKSAFNKLLHVNFINLLAENGNYGVTVFFVISGFLITKNMLKRYGKLHYVNTLDFYILRFSRIMPCLLLMLLMIVIFDCMHISIFQNEENTTSLYIAIFSVITFWHNILMQKVGYFNYCLNILWSLSVEEVFYFAFPILILATRKKSLLLCILFTFIIISPIYRALHSNNEIIALYDYFSCFDAISMGCIVAIILENKVLLNIIKVMLIYCSSIWMVVVYFYSGIMKNIIFGPTLMAMGAALFLIGSCYGTCEIRRTASSFLYRFFCLLGKSSYEIYLFHIIILAFIKELVNTSSLNEYIKIGWLFIFLATSILISRAIAIFYSQPSNLMLRSILPRTKRLTAIHTLKKSNRIPS